MCVVLAQEISWMSTQYHSALHNKKIPKVYVYKTALFFYGTSFIWDILSAWLYFMQVLKKNVCFLASDYVSGVTETVSF